MSDRSSKTHKRPRLSKNQSEGKNRDHGHHNSQKHFNRSAAKVFSWFPAHNVPSNDYASTEAHRIALSILPTEWIVTGDSINNSNERINANKDKFMSFKDNIERYKPTISPHQTTAPPSLQPKSLIPSFTPIVLGYNIPQSIVKYFSQRHRFFSRFSLGCLLDFSGWYSITPEYISIAIAQRSSALYTKYSTCYDSISHSPSHLSTPIRSMMPLSNRYELFDQPKRLNIVIDAFCGCGGNSVHFARYSDLVIACDTNLTKLRIAYHNARIYGVADKIIFLHCNYLRSIPLLAKLKPFCVFLAPPWGGLKYDMTGKTPFNIITNMSGIDGMHLYTHSLQITPHIMYSLPWTIDPGQMTTLAALPPCTCNIFTHNDDSKLNHPYTDYSSSSSSPCPSTTTSSKTTPATTIPVTTTTVTTPVTITSANNTDVNSNLNSLAYSDTILCEIRQHAHIQKVPMPYILRNLDVSPRSSHPFQSWSPLSPALYDLNNDPVDNCDQSRTPEIVASSTTTQSSTLPQTFSILVHRDDPHLPLLGPTLHATLPSVEAILMILTTAVTHTVMANIMNGNIHKYTLFFYSRRYIAHKYVYETLLNRCNSSSSPLSSILSTFLGARLSPSSFSMTEKQQITLNETIHYIANWSSHHSTLFQYNPPCPISSMIDGETGSHLSNLPSYDRDIEYIIWSLYCSYRWPDRISEIGHITPLDNLPISPYSLSSTDNITMRNPHNDKDDDDNKPVILSYPIRSFIDHFITNNSPYFTTQCTDLALYNDDSIALTNLKKTLKIVLSPLPSSIGLLRKPHQIPFIPSNNSTYIHPQPSKGSPIHDSAQSYSSSPTSRSDIPANNSSLRQPLSMALSTNKYLYKHRFNPFSSSIIATTASTPLLTSPGSPDNQHPPDRNNILTSNESDSIPIVDFPSLPFSFPFPSSHLSIMTGLFRAVQSHSKQHFFITMRSKSALIVKHVVNNFVTRPSKPPEPSTGSAVVTSSTDKPLSQYDKLLRLLLTGITSHSELYPSTVQYNLDSSAGSEIACGNIRYSDDKKSFVVPCAHHCSYKSTEYLTQDEIACEGKVSQVTYIIWCTILQYIYPDMYNTLDSTMQSVNHAIYDLKNNYLKQDTNRLASSDDKTILNDMIPNPFSLHDNTSTFSSLVLKHVLGPSSWYLHCSNRDINVENNTYLCDSIFFSSLYYDILDITRHMVSLLFLRRQIGYCDVYNELLFFPLHFYAPKKQSSTHCNNSTHDPRHETHPVNATVSSYSDKIVSKDYRRSLMPSGLVEIELFTIKYDPRMALVYYGDFPLLTSR